VGQAIGDNGTVQLVQEGVTTRLPWCVLTKLSKTC